MAGIPGARAESRAGLYPSSARMIGGRALLEVVHDVTFEQRADRSETEEPPDQTAPHRQLALVRDRRPTVGVGFGAQCLLIAVERASEVSEGHGGAGEADLFDRLVRERPRSTGEAQDSTRLVAGHEVAAGDQPRPQPLEHLLGRRRDVHLAAAERDGGRVRQAATSTAATAAKPGCISGVTRDAFRAAAAVRVHELEHVVAGAVERLASVPGGGDDRVLDVGVRAQDPVGVPLAEDLEQRLA